MNRGASPLANFPSACYLYTFPAVRGSGAALSWAGCARSYFYQASSLTRVNAMYAIFEDGSRQYKVAEGDLVKVDYRVAEVGTRVEFPRVLLFQNGDDTRIGQPLVDGMRVLGDVVEHPSTKTYIQHFRRRKNSRRLRGHRQWFTSVRVRHILLPGQEPPAPAPEAPAPATPPAGTAPTEPTAGASPVTPAQQTEPAQTPPSPAAESSTPPNPPTT
jgi:large subunit ribosomal protein L21